MGFKRLDKPRKHHDISLDDFFCSQYKFLTVFEKNDNRSFADINIIELTSTKLTLVHSVIVLYEPFNERPYASSLAMLGAIQLQAANYKP